MIISTSICFYKLSFDLFFNKFTLWLSSVNMQIISCILAINCTQLCLNENFNIPLPYKCSIILTMYFSLSKFKFYFEKLMKLIRKYSHI